MQPVTILFGTESGNAQSLAKRAGEELAEAGVAARVIDMMDFEPAELGALERLLIITSTYGNGDPPSNAEALHAYVMKVCPELPTLQYSVCSLGDTTYDRFANCGREFDERLSELGARCLVARRDCDVDYDPPFEEWFAEVLAVLTAAEPAGERAPVEVEMVAADAEHDPPGTRRNPFSCRVLENENLNGPGSDKRTHHLVLDVAEQELPFVPGDSIGIWPDNDPALVEAILAACGLSADAPVSFAGEPARLGDVLATKLSLVHPDARLLKFLGDNPDAGELVLDLLQRTAKKPDAAKLVDLLRPISPRLYSVASSPLAHPGQVHLLVDIVRYELLGSARWGVTSQLVAERCPVGHSLPIYLHSAPNFRMGPDDRDQIMVGPGTGIAPFRAFLEQREQTKATGRNWLFSGSRCRETDFLYQADLERWHASGLLSRLDLAFSRDQAEKIYVQHRMREHAAELWQWIESGAAIYVCGDKNHMAHDVHEALVQIMVEQGSMIEALARQRLDRLADAGRYQRDVY